MKRYESVALTLTEEIEGGIYKPGERLPGVRKLAVLFSVSVSTVVEALKIVEDHGLLDVAERSGHFVAYPTHRPIPPALKAGVDTHKVVLKPCPVTQSEWVMNLVRATLAPDVVQLGAAVPHSDFLAVKGVNKALKAVCAHSQGHSDHYDFAPGYEPLRGQIALRMQDLQCNVQHTDMVITNGCQNALVLALKAVTQPGDVIAIESPTFYGLLHVIESLGLQALEIPTDPTSGISLSALTLACEQWDVKACVLIPNFVEWLPHRRTRILRRRHTSSNLWQEVLSCVSGKFSLQFSHCWSSVMRPKPVTRKTSWPRGTPSRPLG